MKRDTSSDGSRDAGRIIAGAMSCALLGFLIEPLGFWSGPHPGPGIRLPMIGPAAGAVIGTVIGLTCGGVQLRGLTKYLAIGLLCGIPAGLFLGAVAFPLVMTALDNPEQLNFRSKEFAGYQRKGILWGLSIGAGCGLAGGGLLHVRQKDVPADGPAPL